MRGAICGVAIGDALGFPYENMTSEEIAKEKPYISEYRAVADEAEKGVYSDDTMLSLDIVKGLLEDGYINPEKFLSRIDSYYIRGVGPIILMALYRHRFKAPWEKCGMNSSYNGSAMRAIPLGLWHGEDTCLLWQDCAVSCYTTHANPTALASTLVMAYAAAYLSRVDVTDFDGGMLLARLIDLSRQVEVGLGASSREKMLYTQLEKVAEMGNEITRCAREIGSSVYAAESTAAAIMCFLNAPCDFDRIMQTSIEIGGDADSVASMAGGLCGSLCGIQCINAQMLDALAQHEAVRNIADAFERACAIHSSEDRSLQTE